MKFNIFATASVASLLLLSLSYAQTSKQSTPVRIGALSIPKITFSGASVDEAVRFFEIKTKEIDPQKTGLTFLVDDTPRALPVPLTIQLDNVTVADAVRYVAMMARLEMTLVGDAVQLKHSAAVHPPFQASKPTPRVESRSAVIIPKVQFRGASLGEAIEFFRVKGQQHDPANGNVPIIIDPDLIGKKQATITLDLTDMPLSKALTYAANLVNADVICLGDAFYIQPSGGNSSVIAPPAAPVAPVTPPKPADDTKKEMALANDWMPRQIMTAQEMLRSLAFFSLAAVGNAAEGQEATPQKILWDLEWLMPLAEAEKKLPGVQRVQRDYRLQNPCFPQNSIYVKCFFGNFVDPNSHETFKEANLIFDAKQQLISVELVHNHPKLTLVGWEDRQQPWWTGEPWMTTPKDVAVKDLPALTGKKQMPGPDGRREPYYDFISLKANGSATQQVWYQIRQAGPGVTSIHTLLVKGTAYPVIVGVVVENVRWYLTAPFARKLLDIAKANKPASSPVR